MPPSQSVGGAVTDVGAEVLDPTGVLRRQRRVVNQFASATVTIGDISRQALWFSQRERWGKRVRRAMTVLHAAECAQAAEVRFVFVYFVFKDPHVTAGSDTPAWGLMPLWMSSR